MLKGVPIVITEDLTRINAARLRQVRDLDCVVNSWTRDGEIYAKTHSGYVTKVDKTENAQKLQQRLTEKRDERGNPHAINGSLTANKNNLTSTPK